MRSLSVCLELIIQMEGSRTVGVKVCQFLVACFWFQPSTRKPLSSAQYMDDAFIASLINTESNARLFGYILPREQAISRVVRQTLGE